MFLFSQMNKKNLKTNKKNLFFFEELTMFDG